MIARVLVYLVLLGIGIGLYYGIDCLPPAWKDWLAGKKTQFVGWAAIVLPEAIDILAQVQSFGLFDYAPGPWQKVIMQGIGVLTLVCRLRTRIEAV